MKPPTLALLFVITGLMAFADRAAAQNTTAPAATTTLPSTEISTFINNGLPKLLEPLPAASVVEKNPPKKTPAKPKKNAKRPGKNATPGVAKDPGQGVTDVGGGDLKVPDDVRTQVMTLNTQLSAQAGTAPSEQKPVYQEALAISKLFSDIMDARDAQIAAIGNVLKNQEETDAASTGTTTTGRTVAQNTAAARQKTVIDDNNDINDIDAKWLKTAAGYQQQINYQMDQLRAREKAAMMGPAAPGPTA